MQGLLDFVKTPAGQGALSGLFGWAANARKGTPWNNVGRGGLAGVIGYSNALDRVQQADESAQTKRIRDMQIEDMLRKRTEEENRRAGTQKFTDMVNPTAQALSGGGGPTAANAAKLPDQKTMQYFSMLQNGLMTPQDYMTATAPKEPEAFTLGEGQVRFKGNQVVAQGPEKKPTLPSAVQEYEYARTQGYNKSFEQFQLDQRKAGANGGVTVKLPAFESEQQKAYGKGMGDLRQEIQNTAFRAPSTIANLNRMEQLLAGVEGGKLAPLGTDIASAAQSLGIKLDPKLGNKQAAEALAIEMALGMRQPGSGPMTDKDFENFLNAVPGLAKSTEGRQQITKTLRAKAERDKQVAKMARDYAKRNNGNLDDGFLDELSEFQATNPVFGGSNQSLIDQADAIVRGR